MTTIITFVKECLSFVKKEKLLAEKRGMNKRLKQYARLLVEIEPAEYEEEESKLQKLINEPPNNNTSS